MHDFNTLEKQLEQAVTHVQKAELLLQLATLCREAGDTEQMEEYARKALELPPDDIPLLDRARIFKFLGFYEIDTGTYANALEWLRKARSILSEQDNKEELADVYNAFGIVYNALGQPGRALEYNFDALRICEQLEDREGIGNVCHQIGGVYSSLENTRSALEYLKRSLEILEELKGVASAPVLYLDIADAYVKAEEYGAALEYYQKAQNAYESLGTVSAIPLILLSIGKLFLKTGRYEAAMTYAREGLSFATAQNNKEDIMNASLVIARIHIQQEQFSRALQYIDDAAEIEEKLYSQSARMEIDLLKSAIYEKLGDYHNAYRHYRSYADRERAYQAQIHDKLSKELEIQHEKERKEHEAELYRLKNIELVKARKTAENASQAKTRFLTTMSHEIRTPINGVIGMAQILSTTDLTAEQQDYLDMLIASGNALLHLVNDILDLSKIEAGKTMLSHEYFNLADVLKEVIGIVQPRADEKQIRMTLWYTVDVPREFIGDPGRIRQILLNLIGNSIKFTHDGDVTVSIRERSRTGTVADIEFIVRDTGIGISDADKERIFDAFLQADSSDTRQYDGSGLGLTITRKLVEIMNGTIAVESKKNSGSIFTVVIPLQTAQKDSDQELHDIAAASSVIDSHAPGRSIHALIVEDKQVNQKVAERLLGKLGCTADIAIDGKQALEQVKNNTYDIIFMDCQMPVMDGYEATRLIRDPGTGVPDPSVPIVAMTAHALKGDREKCIEAGMDDYMAKPIVLKKLKEILDKWVRV